MSTSVYCDGTLAASVML